MQIPLEVSFRNMDHSDAVETAVRERVAKLEQLSDEITSCHVFIDAPHRNHQKGNLFEIRIEVRVPGSELAVSHNPGDSNAHEDAHVAIRDAFDAMKRQVKKWKDQRKHH